MKVLFISTQGSSLPLAYKMVLEGDDIRMWIEDKDSKEVGDGIIEKVDSWKPSIIWSDLVIIDDVKFGDIADLLRGEGKPVFGGSRVFDELEDDRGLGQKMFKALGMDILPRHDFKDFEEAISFAASHPQKLVIKVNGKAQNNKMLSYVGQDESGRDIIPMLEKIKSLDPKDLEGIELQEHVDGVEVACGGFFNGKDFLEPIEINFEHKKLMNGNIGPQTGEMGTGLLWIDKVQPIYKETIGRFVPLLKKEGYVGHFDINTIINEDGLFPLEMTCRFGYPTLHLQLETMDLKDTATFFLKVAKGEIDSFDVKDPASVCVCICTPPLPYTSKDIYESYSKDMPVLLREDSDGEGLHLGYLKNVDDELIITGECDVAMVACAGSDSFEEAREKAYENVKQVIIPNMIYRTDIGEGLEKKIDKITELGYLEYTSENEETEEELDLAAR